MLFDLVKSVFFEWFLELKACRFKLIMSIINLSSIVSELV